MSSTPPNNLPVGRKPNGQFAKGVSGNPTGKSPRRIPVTDPVTGKVTWITQTQLFQRDIAEVHKVLVDITLNPNAKDRDRIAAGNILMNRAFGTPKQNIAVETKNEGEAIHAVTLKEASTEALRELVLRLSESTVINAEFDESDNDDE